MNASLFIDVPHDSEDAWGSFQIEHGLTHQTVYAAMLRRGLVPLYYPLMDFPRERNDAYLMDHWQVHVSNARLLGLHDVPDLATVDFDDVNQYETWLETHAQVHAAENRALGLR